MEWCLASPPQDCTCHKYNKNLLNSLRTLNALQEYKIQQIYFSDIIMYYHETFFCKLKLEYG